MLEWGVADALLGGADFKHLRSAHRAFTLSCGTAILHRDLHGVFNLTLSLAFHTVRFSCHGNLLLAGPSRGRNRAAYSLGPGLFPLLGPHKCPLSVPAAGG